MWPFASRTSAARTTAPRLWCEPLEDRTVPTAAVAPTGVVGWWAGDGNAADRVGANPGTLNGGVTFSPGEVGSAFGFNGSNYVSATTTGLPTGSSDRTLEMWVKLSSIPSSGEAYFAGYGAFGSSNQTYHLGTTGANLFWSQWGSGIGGPALTANTWYHVAVTNVGNTATLYLNGVAVGTRIVTIDTPAGTSFYVGRIPGALGDTRKLDGAVDEVCVYNRALGAAELRAIYLAGPDGRLANSPVTVSPPSVVEGATGTTTPMTFTVQRAGSLAGALTVDWATADDTAAAGSDYVAGSGTITFADGEASKTIQVLVSGDNAVEPDETFRMVLTPAGGTPVMSLGTIRTDDYNTAGSLDTTFSGDGVATIAGYTAYDTVVQADGKVIVVGSAGGDFKVTRLNADGTPDATFGTGGTVTTDLKNGADAARAVTIQTDGKIVVAGWTTVLVKGKSTSQNALVRYNPNGTLDTSYGSKGVVITSGTGGIADIALDGSGRVVATGVSGTGDMMVCRYNANGTPDNTFDGDGKRLIDFAGGADGGHSLAIQADGRIVVGGWAQITETGREARTVVVRLTTNGSLDTSFDGDGKAFPAGFEATDNLSWLANPSVALQPDGRIVLGGTTPDGMDFLLSRLTTNGSLDTTFGTNGFTQSDFGGGIDWINGLAVQPDGKIVAVGSVTNPGGYDTSGIARYSADGVLDTTFGTDGLTRLQLSDYGNSNNAVAIGPDGKIVAAGSFVSRYLGS